jgi:DNA-binding PadR family transcriptional regulator
MMEDIFEYSGTRLEPGTLYGAISRLEQRGWIEALPSDDRRRPYQITATGVTALREQLAAWDRVISTGLQRLLAL